MSESKDPVLARLGPELTDTQKMMYAFGDSRRPQLETSKVMEAVVMSQVTGIITKAAKVASSRGSKTLALEDILFLMRRNPVKVQRLVKYLVASEVANQSQTAADGDPPEQQGGRVSRRCRDFYQRIDEGGQLAKACREELADEIYLERLVRNERVTRGMSDAKYEEFCRARAVGFRGRHSQEFQAGMEKVVEGTHLGLDKVARRVLSYLSYESLGSLVELCLLVRRDAARDPVARLAAPLVIDPSYPSVQVPIEGEKEGGVDWVASRAAITVAELREVVRRLQHGRGGTGPHGMPLIAL